MVTVAEGALPWTIIFCENIDHAGRMRQSLVNAHPLPRLADQRRIVVKMEQQLAAARATAASLFSALVASYGSWVQSANLGPVNSLPIGWRK